MEPDFVDPKNLGLWILDVQERLFPLIDHNAELLEALLLIQKTWQLFGLPIVVSEQSPEKLGTTLEKISRELPSGTPIFAKSSFSGYYEPAIKKAVDALAVTTWVLTGIEAHICVLQTAKDLLRAKKNVIVLNDAISSRSLYDYSTAIGEIRDLKVRITSTDTLIYEMVRDAEKSEFKELLPFIKKRIACNC